jgi:dolichol-phosphate mannosyltransferase
MLYSVILPTYNERENLPIIFYLIDKYLTEASLKYEVVIVDDSSPDGTLEVAQAIRMSFGQDKVIMVSRRGKLGTRYGILCWASGRQGKSHHPHGC